MMSDDRLTISCPSCSARMRVPATAAGKRVRCPKCKSPITVEAPAEAEAPAAPAGGLDDVFDGLAQGTAVESVEERHARQQAVATARSRAQVSKPEAARSAASRRRFDWSTWIVNFGAALIPRGVAGRVTFGVLLLAILLVALGLGENRLRGHWREEPLAVTCQQLINDGPGDNAHVLVSDFALLPDYVYQEGIGKWHGAWAPVLPIEELEARVAAELKVSPDKLGTISMAQRDTALAKIKPSDFGFKIIASFPEADGEEYMERMLDADTLEGTLFTDGFSNLSRRDRSRRNLLESSYPRTDLDHCWMLVVGRKPASEALANTYLFGGAGLAVVVLLAAAWRAAKETA